MNIKIFIMLIVLASMYTIMSQLHVMAIEILSAINNRIIDESAIRNHTIFAICFMILTLIFAIIIIYDALKSRKTKTTSRWELEKK